MAENKLLVCGNVATNYATISFKWQDDRSTGKDIGPNGGGLIQ
jgi:hypothetical protein